MILITGGGTGGHLAIAKAICEEYNKKDIRPIYIGSVNGQDRAWFEGYPGFSKCFFLQSGGVVNKRGLGKLASLFNIIKQAFECKKIFKEYDVDRVFSVGGYSAAPASFAAIFFGKPLFIHEQNAVSGRLNSLLKSRAKEFFGSYKNASYHTSYPVAQRFFDVARERTEVKKVLFLGGSQGASFINSFAKELALKLHDEGIKVMHQCGNNDYEELKEFYKKHELEVDLFAFDKNLHDKMGEADFAVSRSGASSFWELVSANLPTLFVPFPYAASDHQYFNAKALSDEGLCFLKRQNEMQVDEVFELIKNADVKKISNALKEKISPEGAKTIVEVMENESK